VALYRQALGAPDLAYLGLSSVPDTLPSISKTKTRRKRNEMREESIVLKYPKAKRCKLNATGIRII
jgi:hypothetical protein